MAVTVRGGVPAGDFFALLAAEIVGYFAGAETGLDCAGTGGWLGGRVEGVQLRCGSIVFPSVAPLLQTAALPADAPCTCPPLHLPQERSCCGRFTCRT